MTDPGAVDKCYFVVTEQVEGSIPARSQSGSSVVEQYNAF